MIYLVLHQIGEGGTFGSGDEGILTAVPLSIIGPIEEYDGYTKIYMSEGFGVIKVKETMQEIFDKVTEVMENRKR